ncbi:MAG TPA: TMEM175 family protein, partial [Parafilimonas sp.]
MRDKNNIRLEAFSDGIFAIAITLLILEIKVPPISSVHSVNGLWLSLAKLWPS